MSATSKSVRSKKTEKADPLDIVTAVLRETIPTVKTRIEDARRACVVTHSVLLGAGAISGIDQLESTGAVRRVRDATLALPAPTDDQRAALEQAEALGGAR